MSTDLTDLQYAYGYALDDRDADALGAVFDPDYAYRIFAPGAAEPLARISEHDAFARMIRMMTERYTRTMHAMSNPLNAVDPSAPERATGRVYCVAHHVIADEEPARTFVVYVRYDDEFRRGTDAVWRILRRDVHFLWFEDGNAPVAWEVAAQRGRLV
ncbi:nuclear transport factor 2 family protein [Nocardioides sp. cx-173]|uniref:nuclear transport factor 2 family protein n=1 Tax=Nocardioides sp. cx-173 TaxID=2898796 RepID=UPI001E2C8EC2|nr:nuclear transport factor 2 family protein [Nocardioides sp. cx-173]MCD4524250.1 nuclear transport factor 2 family protein [Nocardioides sp. cx-173]UGB41642.1 nuclear transport factor 2 family protein [Nocardioides sp. cx-173]